MAEQMLVATGQIGYARPEMLVLGIETSCDETGVAVYDTARGLLAQEVHTQAAMHADYGGVVPELDGCFAALDLQSCLRREPEGTALPA